MSKVLDTIGTVLGTIAPFLPPPFNVIAKVGAVVFHIAARIAKAFERPPVSAQKLAWTADPNAGVPYAVGRCAVGGVIVYRHEHGGMNADQSIVTVMSLGPIDSLPSLIVENTATAIDAGGQATGYYAGSLWWKAQLGATPEAAALTAARNTLPAEWTSAHKLSGLAAEVLTLELKGGKDNRWSNGTPQVKRLGKWVKVYDPRLDSTMPGGAGSHRALDETTYTWSEDPWLHALTWALGRWQNGVRVMGVGQPLASIDIASFARAANVSLANGWTIAGGFDSNQSKWGVLKAMARAGGGETVSIAGVLTAIVQQPLTPVGTIAAADLVGDARVPAMKTRRDRKNGIVPNYLSEAHGWEVVAAPAIRVSAWETQDGGRRTAENAGAFPFTPTAKAAAQLATYELARARELGPVTLALPPRFMAYRPGDLLSCAADLTEPGLTGQVLRVRERALDPAGLICSMSLETETPTLHDFALGQAGGSPPAPALRGPRPDLGAPTGWTMAGGVVSGGGVDAPALTFAGAANDPNVAAVLFEVRVAGTSAWVDAGSAAGTATTYMVTQGIASSTSYEGAVSYRDLLGRVSDRLVLTASAVGRAGDNAALIAASSTDLAPGSMTAAWVSASVARISVPAHNRLYPDKTRAVNAGTVDVAPGAAVYVFYDDGARAGGTVTFQATTVSADAFESAAHPARHFVDSIRAPSASGGTSTGGGGSRPPGGGAIP